MSFRINRTFCASTNFTRSFVKGGKLAKLNPIFLLILLLLLFFGFASSTFPYREVLLLKTLFRQSNVTAFDKSYIVHRIIWLFSNYQSGYPAQAILRATMVDSVMEEDGDVVRQGTAFDETIVLKSVNMLSGLWRKENVGPEPSVEMQRIFKGTNLSSVRRILRSPFLENFGLTSCTDGPVEGWRGKVMTETIMAWKHFRTYFEFIPCSNELMNALNSKTLHCSSEDRLTRYLKIYDQFMKPIVHQFDLGNSFAKVMTVYYFFQYLHQFSRMYAGSLTIDLIDLLERTHREFIQDTDAFVTSTDATNLPRTFISSLPFEGRWVYSDHLDEGVLIPSKLNPLQAAAHYTTHKPLQKVSLYRVHLQHEAEKSSPGCIRMLLHEEKYVELVVYTRMDWNEVWLEKFVKKLNADFRTQKEILDMIL